MDIGPEMRDCDAATSPAKKFRVVARLAHALDQYARLIPSSTKEGELIQSSKSKDLTIEEFLQQAGAFGWGDPVSNTLPLSPQSDLHQFLRPPERNWNDEYPFLFDDTLLPMGVPFAHDWNLQSPSTDGMASSTGWNTTPGCSPASSLNVVSPLPDGRAFSPTLSKSWNADHPTARHTPSAPWDIHPVTDGRASSQTRATAWNAGHLHVRDCSSSRWNAPSPAPDGRASSQTRSTGWGGTAGSPAGSSQTPSTQWQANFPSGVIGGDGASPLTSSAAEDTSSPLKPPEAETSSEACSEWLDLQWRSEVAKFIPKVEKLAKDCEDELAAARQKQLETKACVESILQTISKLSKNVQPLTAVLDLMKFLISNSVGALDSFATSIHETYQNGRRAVENLKKLDMSQFAEKKLKSAYKVLEKDSVTYAFQKYVSAVTAQLQGFLEDQKPSVVSLLYKTLNNCGFDLDNVFESAYSDADEDVNLGHHACPDISNQQNDSCDWTRYFCSDTSKIL